MSLEESINALAAAINRHAAILEKPPIITFDPAFQKIPLAEAEPAPAPVKEKPAKVEKPKSAPVEKVVEPEPEPTPEPEVEETPVTEKEAAPAPEPTGPVTHKDIRETVRAKIAGNAEVKNRWKALLAEWEVGNVSEIENGDLPRFMVEVNKL